MSGAGPRALVLVALLIAAAGCSEAGGTKVLMQSAAPDLGTVAGTVLDDSALPVEGVAVGLQELIDFKVLSGPDGSFLVGNLTPGPHTIVATKVGFLTVQKNINVEAAEKVEGVELVLRPIALPNQPIVVVLPGHGFLSCSFTTPGFSTQHTQFCGVDANNQPEFLFDVDVTKGLVGVVGELSWTPTSAATGQTLRLGLWKDPKCGASRCDTERIYEPFAEGKSPLRKVQGNASAPFRDNLEAGKPTRLGLLAIIRDAAPAGQNPADVGVVWQQPVEFYASIFYNQDIPPGYAMFK